ncbi:hypothetical protein K458DRAFT_357885 [Lentithecium fluviatile CBS 122367]|uniref:Ams2/SPT21 N-terminal domain-containing protein n=1 Tax=Lentithecium fluviatile CBS 122367 TaxID=1168545 RepID=A0A6G1JGJ3_9PLEO|nr:hypothetical protein K458DRAFT_357885 [Lentithecium fluviatile CBS 122367]
MSTPSESTVGALQFASAGSPADTDRDGMTDIPRRLMRVKVLYTFDDQNKSNCLARLPNALSIPTVSLDETTQVGVIELKTCIQAIVSASPELVAKLGHDYTVYAFDYSEYETPLVGQGMLSWILASASTTPNAPAEQSQTMVTGRVCKNILGLFSNGIKETLEVKLKLVPVPTCLQSEYVENMERYHNLSKVLPEGLPDYNAWAQFLEANPAIRQLAQPTPINPAMSNERSHMGGLESVHQMLTRPTPSDHGMRFDSLQDQQQMSFNSYDTRASSPALSTASFYQYSFQPDARPDSRASFHSDSGAYSQQYYSPADNNQEPQEEGPPKKRARITKAKRPRKTVLSANNDSLRVTASTAASVRLHKPAAAHAGAAVSAEQVPRAPTPRPANAAMPPARGSFRPVAPSLLRHGSIDSNRPYVSPYEPGIFSDNALDSGDDERAGSPGDTPLNMPSSPPVMAPRTASSSPDLPSLPLPNDSGFVSDIPSGREEEEMGYRNKPWAESDLAATAETRTDSNGPSRTRSHSIQSVLERPAGDPATSSNTSAEEALLRSLQAHVEPPCGANQQVGEKEQSSVSTNEGTYRYSACSNRQAPDLPIPNTTSVDAEPLDANALPSASTNNGVARPTEVANLPAPPKGPRGPKTRGLERSHTWSGEPTSDAACPAEGKSQQPRSGSGAKRRHHIKDRLEKALESGQMPQYCNNCGQIDTPAWRRAYTRIEYGSPAGIQLSSKGTSICALEPMEPEDGDSTQRYRIFKQALEIEEAESKTFTTLTLCNPCGLWLGKRNAMRPHQVWAKAQANASGNAEKPKRKRKPKKPKGENDSTMSDAIVPESDCYQPDMQDEAKFPSILDGTTDGGFSNQAPGWDKPSNFNAAENSQLDEAAAQAALLRAIQSSPVGLRGSKDSPIEVEEDLTPKPTRRLLFPSPRRSGEVKSLGHMRSFPSLTAPGTGMKATEGATGQPGLEFEGIDKENCPPAGDEEDDGLFHLFNDHGSTRTTPTKGRSTEDSHKTPTPGSRRRVPLTPKRSTAPLGLITPSKVLKTPRTAIRATPAAPETPFTRQLNALLSDCMAGSPSQTIDFSAFPTFNTPGRTNTTGAHFGDLLSNDFLSSDLPIPSSPPDALNFSVFEDPNTSTVGLWSGASIFDGSDAVIPDPSVSEHKGRRPSHDAPEFKMNDISMDFSALLEGVVGDANKNGDAPSQTFDGQLQSSVEETEITVTVETVDTVATTTQSPLPTAGEDERLSTVPETTGTVMETAEKAVGGQTGTSGSQEKKSDEAEPAAEKAEQIIQPPTRSCERTPATVQEVDSTVEKTKSPVVPVQCPTKRAKTPEVRIKLELVGYGTP